MSTTAAAAPVITLTRILNASRERVFDAWTTPELICKWFGPTLDSRSEAEVDLRVGGRYAFHVLGANGHRNTAYGQYVEIVPPSRLVMTWNLSVFPEGGSSLITVDLVERDGKTEITISHAQLPSEEMRNAHQQGWQAGLNKLVLLFDPTAEVDTSTMKECAQ